LRPHLAPRAVVSDVGSVKAQVVTDMAAHLPNYVHFVPTHPVACTEYSGPHAGFAELFAGRRCILTPPDGTDATAVKRLSAGVFAPRSGWAPRSLRAQRRAIQKPPCSQRASALPAGGSAGY
jgi:hypothetical protein